MGLKSYNCLTIIFFFKLLTWHLKHTRRQFIAPHLQLLSLHCLKDTMARARIVHCLLPPATSPSTPLPPDGVIFAKLRGFSHVMMEMDSLEIVHLWSSRHTDRSLVAPILHDFGEHSIGFKYFFIKHIRRSANNSFHLYVLSSLAL
jgi:hypothetical protein